MRKSVREVPTAGEQTQQKSCRTSSDIGAELENHTVGRGPMWDRKRLKIFFSYKKLVQVFAQGVFHDS
jgi:hypothetical protein